MGMSKTVSAITSLAVAIVVGGCGQQQHGVTQNRVLTQQALVSPAATRIDVLKIDSYKRFGNEYVAGILKNDGGKSYQYVEVTVNCYDSAGNLIEPVTGTRAGLGPGATWRFKLRMTRPAQVDHYQVASIVAW
jgi:hypothetical protein